MGLDELEELEGELEEEGSLEEELEEELFEELDSSLSLLSSDSELLLCSDSGVLDSGSLLSIEELEEMNEKDSSEVELTTPGI